MNNFVKYLLVLVCLLVLNYCCGVVDPNENKKEPDVSKLIFGDTLNITYKDTLHNYEEDIWITFDSLVSDSRCPMDVFCFWEGNAEIGFIFGNYGEELDFRLNTHPDFKKEATICLYKIILVNVAPYPRSDTLYTPDSYSVQIVVKK
ncbi:hypothetical protein ACFLS9_01060 [Bacteroidota bacterium]